MDVYLTVPPGAATPWELRSYALNVTMLKCDISNPVEDHPVTDSEEFLFSQYSHGTTRMMITGVITDNSDFPGTDAEAKKDNLIEAALKWGLLNIKVQSNCAQLVWRGWAQYGSIATINAARMGGDVIEYEYNMEFIVSEVF